MTGPKKRIAIIDDDVAILQLLGSALKAAGYDVVTLTEPDPGALTEENAVDLLLVDVHLPQIYGDDAVLLLKQRWGLTGLVYLFSGIAEEELKRRAAEVSADGYICKDWGPRRVVELVQSVLPTGVSSP